MLGISCSKLVCANSIFVQADLFEQTQATKNKKDNSAEDVLFKLKDKFGKDSIKFGNMIDEDL